MEMLGPHCQVLYIEDIEGRPWRNSTPGIASSVVSTGSNEIFGQAVDLPDEAAKICRAKRCTSCKSVGFTILLIYLLVGQRDGVAV